MGVHKHTYTHTHTHTRMAIKHGGSSLSASFLNACHMYTDKVSSIDPNQVAPNYTKGHACSASGNRAQHQRAGDTYIMYTDLVGC